MNLSRISRLGLLALTLAATATTIAPQPLQAAPKMAQTAALNGSFVQVTHATKGNVTVAGGKVTLSNFETGMGPQLHVYLVKGDASSNDAVKKAVSAGKFADLGTLKNITGSQSYAVKGAAKGQSIVIWCAKFDVAFGAAKLG